MMPALIASAYFLDGLTNTQVQVHWTLMIRFRLIERLKNVITALVLPVVRPNSHYRMASTPVMQKWYALSKLQEGKCQRFTLFPHSYLPPSPDSYRPPNADLDSCGGSDGPQGSGRLATPHSSPVRKLIGEFEIDPTELDFRGAQPAGKVKVSRAWEIQVER